MQRLVPHALGLYALSTFTPNHHFNRQWLNRLRSWYGRSAINFIVSHSGRHYDLSILKALSLQYPYKLVATVCVRFKPIVSHYNCWSNRYKYIYVYISPGDIIAARALY